jgi:hypothetical protein
MGKIRPLKNTVGMVTEEPPVNPVFVKSGAEATNVSGCLINPCYGFPIETGMRPRSLTGAG